MTIVAGRFAENNVVESREGIRGIFQGAGTTGRGRRPQGPQPRRARHGLPGGSRAGGNAALAGFPAGRPGRCAPGFTAVLPKDGEETGNVPRQRKREPAFWTDSLNLLAPRDGLEPPT
jgi:hypothetical protein